MERGDYNILFNQLRKEYGTPIQSIDEFWALVNLVQTRGDTRILEIGVEKAGTIVFWDKVVGPQGVVVGADICLASIKLDINPQSYFKLIEGDTHTPEIVASIKEAIPEVDFLFLDGDHGYEGVKADFENFSPLVRPGGLIALHDIHDAGVGPFWRELESQYSTEKFHQGSGGIGIGIVYL